MHINDYEVDRERKNPIIIGWILFENVTMYVIRYFITVFYYIIFNKTKYFVLNTYTLFYYNIKHY
jgi:hypothetical protein